MDQRGLPGDDDLSIGGMLQQPVLYEGTGRDNAQIVIPGVGERRRHKSVADVVFTQRRRDACMPEIQHTRAWFGVRQFGVAFRVPHHKPPARAIVFDDHVGAGIEARSGSFVSCRP